MRSSKNSWDEMQVVLLTIKEAAKRFKTKTSNIRYLLDYHPDKIHRYDSEGNIIQKGQSRQILLSLEELEAYFQRRESEMLDDEVSHQETNNSIGFRHLSDAERTKHVHGLHPYMGKFIPQLAHYYLSKNFRKGDIILDPFAGSGTTLVEGNTLSMHTIGVDIAEFNTILMRAKLQRYNLTLMEFEVRHILDRLTRFSHHHWNLKDLKKGTLSQQQLSKFRSLLLGEPQGVLSHFEEGASGANNLSDEVDVEGIRRLLEMGTDVPDLPPFQTPHSEYFASWLAPRTNIEANYYLNLIPDYHYQDLLKVILSSAIRSSRLIKHIDLTRPKEPLKPDEEYVCVKHRGRLCRPITELLKWIRTYSVGKKGVINRIKEFDKLRTSSEVHVINADSTLVDLFNELSREHSGSVTSERFIDGIFTSPPYVGIIDYHQQHRYAYEIFDLAFNEEEEIGAAKYGSSQKAQKTYQELISKVLLNVKRFLKVDSLVFIVANDRYNLYPAIFEASGYELVDEEKRGVYKRADSGGARANYLESIFKIKPIF